MGNNFISGILKTLVLCVALFPADVSLAQEKATDSAEETHPKADIAAKPLDKNEWKQLDQSVDRALKWLVTQQAKDGSFPSIATGLKHNERTAANLSALVCSFGISPTMILMLIAVLFLVLDVVVAFLVRPVAFSFYGLVFLSSADEPTKTGLDRQRLLLQVGCCTTVSALSRSSVPDPTLTDRQLQYSQFQTEAACLYVCNN